MQEITRKGAKAGNRRLLGAGGAETPRRQERDVKRNHSTGRVCLTRHVTPSN